MPFPLSITQIHSGDYESIARQSAKALANLAVNSDNKKRICQSGAIPKLVRLVRGASIPVRIEAVAGNNKQFRETIS